VTFVAGRNLIFLTFAAAYAYRHGARHLVTGVAQTDYSGYPDCRDETIMALQKAISLGMDREFTIHTPLMYRSKKETVELAVRLGALEAMALTHTCYKGCRPPCGECQACRLRAKGFAEAGVRDPLLDIG
jgi:7-cyano-7-deazaguanine synthase